MVKIDATSASFLILTESFRKQSQFVNAGGHPMQKISSITNHDHSFFLLVASHSIDWCSVILKVLDLQ